MQMAKHVPGRPNGAVVMTRVPDRPSVAVLRAAASSDEPYTVVMLVTPEQAQAWLEGNVHNRTVRDSKVEQYGRDMVAGRWMLTHQGIAFDKAGTMIDGQHRLFAIMNTGVSVRMMVTYNAEMETQAVIDGGLIRTMVDVGKLAYGKDVTGMQFAIAKMLAAATLTGTLTRQEQMAAYETHRDAILYATDRFGSKKVRGVTVVPVLTVIARAWYSAPHDKLASFCELLITGDPGSNTVAGYKTVVALRNYLMQRPKSNVKASITTLIYRKTERALAAWVVGENVSMLYPATSELFALPSDEKKGKKAKPKNPKLARQLTRKLAGAHA